MVGTRQWREPSNGGNQAMARAKRDAQPNAEGVSSIPGHRHVITKTRGDQTRDRSLCARLSCGRDEIGERHEVVLIVAGTAVVGPATGDQPQTRVVDVAVHELGGELALGELANPRDPEYRLAAVRPSDRDLVTGLQIAQSVEDPLPIPVDVARDDRRAQLTGGRPTRV